jgi:Zn-dependent peptidase ImmA (M78 family)
MFRESRGLNKGMTGLGEVFRGNLRSMGLLVVESPLPDASLEGFCFYVGSGASLRPCIFANSYRTTWFRRNVVLMHEVGHAIFDAESMGAALDFRDTPNPTDFTEERAQAFAQETLVPQELLRHAAQARGIKWQNLTRNQVAELVSVTHVEQKLILTASVDAGFITAGQEEDLASLSLEPLLSTISPHALTTHEFLNKIGNDPIRLLVGNRTTTLPSRTLRLPVSFVTHVLQACQQELISPSKAAELLMIDESTFERRFGALTAAA